MQSKGIFLCLQTDNKDPLYSVFCKVTQLSYLTTPLTGKRDTRLGLANCVPVVIVLHKRILQIVTSPSFLLTVFARSVSSSSSSVFLSLCLSLPGQFFFFLLLLCKYYMYVCIYIYSFFLPLTETRLSNRRCVLVFLYP